MAKYAEKKAFTRALNLYSDALGIPQNATVKSAKAIIIRVCGRIPRIGAAVRPMGGKVNAEQMHLMRDYMLAHPIEGCDIESILRPAPATPKPEKPHYNPNPLVANRIRLDARFVEQDRRDNFFKSWDWKALRYDTIKKYGPICMCCGAERGQMTANGERVVIQVDHIKPISRYWDLRLDPSNMQVLCHECNKGKSNVDETDFRPKS